MICIKMFVTTGTGLFPFFLICAEPSYSHVCAELHVKCLWENTCLLISCLTVFIQQKGDAATCAEDSFT